MKKKIIFIILGIVLLISLLVALYYFLGLGGGAVANSPSNSEELFEIVRNSVSQHLAG